MSNKITNDSIERSVDEFVRVMRELEAILDLTEKDFNVVLHAAHLGIRKSIPSVGLAVQAIVSGKSSDEIEPELSSAIKELRYARDSALNSVITISHYILLAHESRYDIKLILELCPEFLEIRERIESIENLITAPVDADGKSDSRFYSLSKEYLPKILSAVAKLNRAEDRVLEPSIKVAISERRLKIIAIAGFFVGVVGLLVSAVSLMR